MFLQSFSYKYSVYEFGKQWMMLQEHRICHFSKHFQYKLKCDSTEECYHKSMLI